MTSPSGLHLKKMSQLSLSQIVTWTSLAVKEGNSEILRDVVAGWRLVFL
jgi:hypothetical protein